MHVAGTTKLGALRIKKRQKLIELEVASVWNKFEIGNAGDFPFESCKTEVRIKVNC